jgi:hypothetical protein
LVQLLSDAAFEAAFVALRRLHRESQNGRGVLVAAVWDGAIDTHCHVPIDDDLATAVVGSDDRCDLRLRRDPSITPRHVVIGARRHGLHDVRVKLWSMGTPEIASGPAVATIGGYHVFFLPTGCRLPYEWRATSAETWPQLRSPLSSVPPAGSPAGMLALSTRTSSTAIAVDDAQLDAGVWVGRDPRCALGSDLSRLSRVHAVVVRHAGAIWAIDVASANGTTAGRDRIRQTRLHAGASLVLGRVAALAWRGPATP